MRRQRHDFQGACSGDRSTCTSLIERILVEGVTYFSFYNVGDAVSVRCEAVYLLPGLFYFGNSDELFDSLALLVEALKSECAHICYPDLLIFLKCPSTKLAPAQALVTASSRL